MATLTGMKEGGYYDEHSSLRAESFAFAAPWLRAAIDAMPLPAEDEPLVVADFGCSTGANSIRAVSEIVVALRRRRPRQHVVATHNDLPANDFNTLCRRLWDPRANNYLQEKGVARADTSVRLVPASFYGPLLVPASLHVGLSVMALEWLADAVPVEVPDQIFVAEAPRVVLDAFRAQSRSDLLTFLRHRAVEAVAGGLMLIVYPGRTEDDYTASGGFRALNAALQRAAAAGRIARRGYESLFFPVYQPTLEDVADALRAADADWKAVRVEASEVPVGIVEGFRAGGDPVTYAEAAASLVRGVSEPIVRAALVPPGGDVEVLDDVYAETAALIAAAPEAYPIRSYVVAALLERR